jgi:hypothetical protein
MRWLAVLALALALVAAGCGGDDESSASDEPTVEETTTDETTEETTTDDAGTDTDADFDFTDEDCQALVAAGASLGQAFTGGASSEAGEAFTELMERVPDEIEDDVQVLADWFEEYATELQNIGLEAGQTPTAEQVTQLQAAIANLDSDEVTAASERLGTWAQENCTG